MAACGLPDMGVGKAHGEVCAVGAFEVHAFQLKLVQAAAARLQLCQMLAPGSGDINALPDAAHAENGLPQLFLCVLIAGEHLFRPGRARNGHDAPLHFILHGVIAPGGQRLAARLVGAGYLLCVQPLEHLRVGIVDVQNARAALALGIIQIAAQDIGLHVLQRFHTGILHPDAGKLLVCVFHHHIARTSLKGGPGAQAGKRRALYRARNEHSLSLLGVHAHPYGKFGILFHQFFVHGIILLFRRAAQRASLLMRRATLPYKLFSRRVKNSTVFATSATGMRSSSLWMSPRCWVERCMALNLYTSSQKPA